MIPDAALIAVVNATIVPLCAYILVVCIGRLASMGWWTHKRVWICVYALMAISAGGNMFLVFDGKGHPMPIIGLLAACLWLHESRDRWRHRAPAYMARDATDSQMMVGPK